MLFAFYGKDHQGALQLRKDTREAHVAHLKSGANGCKVRNASPLLDDDGQMCGSLVVVETSDKASADAFFAADPYAKANLFASSQVSALADIFHAWD